MKKISYKLLYNQELKEWWVWKYIEGEQNINFYVVFKHESKSECQEWLNRKKVGDVKNRIMGKTRKAKRTRVQKNEMY